MVSNPLPIDSGLRWLIGFTILFVSFRFQSWWMVLPALLILYSAATNYCAVYHFLKINRQLSRNNYYLSQLPHFNPEPVCIFNDKGQAVFCNSSAEKKFGAFKHLYQITGIEFIKTHGIWNGYSNIFPVREVNISTLPWSTYCLTISTNL